MAANIPAKLRQVGITPYLLRAAQLESAEPVVAYWCTSAILLSKL
jgi:vacuolar protein sorting-associated protein VTA1